MRLGDHENTSKDEITDEYIEVDRSPDGHKQDVEKRRQDAHETYPVSLLPWNGRLFLGHMS